MDEATILTMLSPRDNVVDLAPVVHALSAAPTFLFDERFQRALGSISVALYVQTYVLASATLYASRILAVQAYFATCFGAAMSGKLVAGAWDCAAMRGFRKRMFEDFAKFILGSGNPIFVMLFWPGWWFIGGATWAFFLFCG